MSRTFRFLYWRVCCVMCTTRKKVRGHEHQHYLHDRHIHEHHCHDQRSDAVAERASEHLE